MKRIAIVFVLLLLITTSARAEMLTIAGQKVNMRSGPGTHYPVLWELGAGFPVKRLKRKGNWYRVQDFEGDSGWVFKKLTNKTPFVIVTGKIVNIRKGPGTKNPIVGQAEYGTVLKRLKGSKGWVKVKFPGKGVGWIKANLVWGW